MTPQVTLLQVQKLYALKFLFQFPSVDFSPLKNPPSAGGQEYQVIEYTLPFCWLPKTRSCR
jgi:hypothetical protein